MHLVLFKYMLRYAMKIYDETITLHFPNYHQVNNFKKRLE